jgi:hypothetical protein
VVGSVAGGGIRDKGIRDNRGVRDLPMGGEEEVNNGVRGAVYGGGRGGSDILYGSEIKRDAPKNKGIFALQVEGRFALPLTKEKLTNKKKEGRSVQANIEYLYIRSYGQTASVTSNLWVYSQT